MLELLEDVVDIPGHGYFGGSVDVVPSDGQSTIQISLSVCFHGVALFQRILEVLGVFLVGVADTKVIYDQDEGYRARIMQPEPIDVGCLVVAHCGQAFGQEFVC